MAVLGFSPRQVKLNIKKEIIKINFLFCPATVTTDDDNFHRSIYALKAIMKAEHFLSFFSVL